MPAPIERTASRQSRQRAQHIVDKLPNPLFLADPAGNVLLSNPATSISMGLSLGEFLASNVEDCVRKGYYDISVAREAAAKRQQVSKILTTRLGVQFVANATPILDDRGEVQLTVINGIPIREYDKGHSSFVADDPHERRRRLQYLFGHIFDGDEIVAESRAMREVMITANGMARSDSAVMITGETGTGKEVLARYIHAHSRRSHRPFIPVNAAALPDTLVEAELFGYERGAFTGARTEGRSGLFAAADGGTLFLDEVADLSLPVQAKLLRVLDTGEFRRIGSCSPHRTDVRIITATNKDLDRLVHENLFRADLFYRLNTLPLALPPLRERPEDVIALADKFRRDICRKNDCDVALDAATLAALTSRPWPGNARELRSHIERYILNAQVHGMSGLGDFEHCQQAAGGPDILRLVEIGGPLKDVLSQVEENYVRYMLDLCGGKVGATAGKLGIYRTALHRKLKAYRDRQDRPH